MRAEDEARFAEWWSAVEPTVISLGRRLLGSTDAARDLAQDVAVGALLRFDIFRDATHFRAWILNRSRWLALDRIRVHRRERANEHATAPGVEAYGVSPELDQIMRLIGALPERQQTVLLGSIEGRTASETAATLGVTPATVRSLLRHARLRLTRSMED